LTSWPDPAAPISSHDQVKYGVSDAPIVTAAHLEDR
jgi:hypothetical protein